MTDTPTPAAPLRGLSEQEVAEFETQHRARFVRLAHDVLPQLSEDDCARVVDGMLAVMLIARDVMTQERHDAIVEAASLRAQLAQAVRERDVFDLGRQALASSLAKAEAEAVTLRAALVALKRGQMDGGCWCEVAVGNPMYPTHTAKCDQARAALRDTGGMP